jgi:DNA primase
MISANTIQQILSRIDIVDIVGSFVKLKKRGANYLGLCPFHNEKTPSFTVSPTKEIYKCFGCGRSGNAIGFVMEHEKYSYVEALRWLAQKYDVPIEETEVSPEIKQQQLLAESLFIINHFAQEYFTHTLFHTEEGQNIGLSYFKERGFREEIINKFQLGYCLEKKDDFAAAALGKGYKIEYLQQTGLVVMRNERPADNYHGRVIFPVHNNTGKVLGFGARILKTTDKAPKYINTPENEIYNKSKLLYGAYQARQAIGQADECLLVEGYTDVISLHQAGIENVVASGGTSLTQDQLRLIKKYTSNLTILYDGDAAGIKAALRGLDMAIEEGLNVKLVLLPDSEDPDSYVQKIGAAPFREFINQHKKDFILFKLEVALKDAGNDTTKKATLVNEIAQTIAHINKAEDFTKQQDYIRQCSEILKIDERGLVMLVNKYIRQQLQKKERFPSEEAKVLEQQAAEGNITDEVTDSTTLLQRDLLQEKGLLKILLKFGQLPFDENRTIARYIFEESVELDMIDQPLVKIILLEYKKMMDENIPVEKNNFLYHESQEISSFVADVLNLQNDEELSINWQNKFEMKVLTEKDIAVEQAVNTVHHLQLRKLKKLMEENLTEEINAVNNEERINIQLIHIHLKEMEKKMVENRGSVIIR